jgi:hypothetical protein
MASPELIVAEVRAQFESLLAETLGPEAAGMTMDRMERQLFRRVLELGRGLLRVFVAQRAQATHTPATVTSAGVTLGYLCGYELGSRVLLGRAQLPGTTRWSSHTTLPTLAEGDGVVCEECRRNGTGIARVGGATCGRL